MPSSEEEEHFHFKLNEFFRNYKPPNTSGFEKSDPTPEWPAELETSAGKVADFVQENRDVLMMYAQYLTGEKAGNPENAQNLPVFQLPQQQAIHLDSSYLSQVLGPLTDSSFQLFDLTSDLATDLSFGLIKMIAQYFISRALDDPGGRAKWSMTRLDPRKNLHLAKLWFTASDEEEAEALLKLVKPPKVGFPGYELDSSRNLYLVGEFA